jgi:hypothetical protein
VVDGVVGAVARGVNVSIEHHGELTLEFETDLFSLPSPLNFVATGLRNIQFLFILRHI